MPRLTLRRLVRAALVVGLAGAAVLIAVVLAGWLTVYQALLLGLTAAVLAAVGVVGIGVRRVLGRMYVGFAQNRTVVNELREHLVTGAGSLAGATERVEGALQEVRGATGEDRVELLLRLEQVSEGMDRMAVRIGDLDRDVAGLPSRMDEPIAEAASAAARAVATDLPAKVTAQVYAQVEAHTDLRSLVSPRAPLPPLGGWALDADVMRAVASVLWERRPKLVVECGSGSSTVWLGYLAERLGLGRVIALEHDERYLQASAALIAAHGLRDVVEVRHAPLRPWTDAAGEEYSWYAQTAIADLQDIGLLLVDGPPAAVGRQSRYPAGPLLFGRCGDDAVIVLDDTHRPDEAAIVERWLSDRPDLEIATGRPASARILRRVPGGARSAGTHGR